MIVLAVALGAAVGAPLRYLAGHLLDRGLPWGTIAVNVAGSLLLGLVSGVAVSSPAGWAFWATGFCGGLTTYSAFAVHAHDRGLRVGTAVVLLTVPPALAAAAAGHALGRVLGG